MSATTDTATPKASRRSPERRIAGLRRAGLATFVLLVAQFALGMYVNLDVTVPKADSGHGFAQAMSNGPAGLAAHIGLGLLLILAALGFLVQTILVKRPALIVAAVVGLLSMIGAAASGASFTSNGQNSASITMAVLTVLGLLCYGIALFMLGRAAKRNG